MEWQADSAGWSGRQTVPLGLKGLDTGFLTVAPKLWHDVIEGTPEVTDLMVGSGSSK